jgi:glycosyltransferase involved in cell wall biosynthesis
MKMKIGLYALWNVNLEGHTIRTLGCHARYLAHFLEHCETVRLFTSVVDEPRASNTDQFSDPRLEVVRVPGDSFVSAWRHVGRLRRLVGEHLDGLDALYLRVFDPCTWALAPLCEARRMGMIFDIVGNPAGAVLQRRDWSWAGRWTRRLLFMVEENLVLRAARRHVLLLNGGDVARAFGHRHPAPELVFSSTLEEDEFFVRDDTCTGPEATILYTGFLRWAKGLEDLLQAVANLVHDGRRVRLRLVGSGDPPAYLELLKEQVRSLGLEGLVDFPGYVPLGPALNAEYRAADIYAFPSYSEGAARTLLEASSQSLPGVFTDVGGARELFADRESALLVPVADPPALARALARYLDEPELRRRCIRNARDIAAQHTCGDFIRFLVRRLEEDRTRALAGEKSIGAEVAAGGGPS